MGVGLGGPRLNWGGGPGARSLLGVGVRGPDIGLGPPQPAPYLSSI